MKLLPSLGLLSLMVLLAAAAGCARTAALPEEEIHPAPVEASASRALFFGDWTELLGTTQALPNHSARISAPGDGKVAWLLNDGVHPPIEEGQRVEKGQVIGKLDDSVLRENRKKAEFNVQSLQEQQKQAAIALAKVNLEITRKHESLKKPGDELVTQKLRNDLQTLALD